MSSTTQAGVLESARNAGADGWQTTVVLFVIATAPLLSSPPMVAPIFDIPGLKLVHLLPLFGFVGILAGRGLWPGSDRLEHRAYTIFLCYTIFLAAVFLRSLPNVSSFHAQWAESIPDSKPQYMIGQFLLPMMVACSFLYILRRMRSAEDINRVLLAVVAGVTMVSLVVLGAVFYNPDAVFASSRDAILAVMAATLGLHYNAVSTIMTIMAPLLLYIALKRGSYWTLPYALALAAVLAVKSRTGILTFAGGSALTMVVLGRARILVAAAPLVVVGALAVLGPILVKLLTLGVTEKSGLSLWFLLSGREESVWLPVVLEWMGDPVRFFFGAGAHGIMTSILISSGATGFIAGQAHNLYLEVFVDNGILVFVLFIAIVGAWLVWAWRVGRRIRSQLYWSLYLCIVCFLIAGLSGRLYYPTTEDYLVFPTLAALINVGRLRLKAQTETQTIRSVPAQ